MRWTFALALCVFAVVTAIVTWESRTRSAPQAATWAALLALVLAAWPSPYRRLPWPWRGPDPLRNTLAFVFGLIALAAILFNAIHVGTTGGIGAPWMPAAVATLFLASAIASTRFGRWGWLHRLAWAGAVGVSLWLWYWLTR